MPFVCTSPEEEESGREGGRLPNVPGRTSPPLPYTGTKETAGYTQLFDRVLHVLGMGRCGGEFSTR